MANQPNIQPTPGTEVRILRPTKKEAPGHGKVKMDVQKCPRCGEQHLGQLFRPLVNPDPEGAEMFVYCPKNNQPVIHYGEKKAPEPVVKEVVPDELAAAVTSLGELLKVKGKTDADIVRAAVAKLQAAGGK
jgi:hypothetical protein